MSMGREELINFWWGSVIPMQSVPKQTHYTWTRYPPLKAERKLGSRSGIIPLLFVFLYQTAPPPPANLYGLHSLARFPRLKRH